MVTNLKPHDIGISKYANIFLLKMMIISSLVIRLLGVADTHRRKCNSFSTYISSVLLPPSWKTTMLHHNRSCHVLLLHRRQLVSLFSSNFHRSLKMLMFPSWILVLAVVVVSWWLFVGNGWGGTLLWLVIDCTVQYCTLLSNCKKEMLDER
jgi:hypothetical protein